MLSRMSLPRMLLGLGATLVVLVASISVLPAWADDDDDENGPRDGINCAAGRAGRGDDDGRKGLRVVGLTADQRLICFSEGKPKDASDIGAVSGLITDTRLVGIDFRVQDNALYGVGEAGGLYALNISNAQATLADRLDVALAGTSFGVDFNPAANALRIVSDTGQNLRHSFVTNATTADTSLSYPPATPPAAGVAGAGYTNNDLDATTATTLFDIDSALDQVAIQSPANSGQLVPTGKLTVDTSAQVGFDIYSTVRNGATADNRALASLFAGGQASLYSVNVLTGRAAALGAFSANNQVIGIAIPLNQQ